MNSSFSRVIFSCSLAALTAIAGITAVAATQSAHPLTLLNTTPLPGINGGDFDHFAVNRAGNRLYVSAEVHHSIEVFNLKTGEHLASASDVVKTPHTIAFVPDKNELFVADGGDSSIKVLDGTSLRLIKRIALSADPDAGIYDATTRLFFIGNGGKPAKEAFSDISIISVDGMREAGKIRLQSANLESMAIDEKSSTLYVNMRDRNLIGVVSLKSRSLVRTFPVAGMNLNTTLAYDDKNHVLMVGGRKPGKLLIVNPAGGSIIQALDSVETADDMTYDAKSQRIYISGAGGLDVYTQTSVNHYALLAHYDTLGGKTSVYVPSIKRFFVVHTKGVAAAEAGLQIYRVNP